VSIVIGRRLDAVAAPHGKQRGDTKDDEMFGVHRNLLSHLQANLRAQERRENAKASV
jgi:hypothetical protein